jgi:hypothetical protein
MWLLGRALVYLSALLLLQLLLGRFLRGGGGGGLLLVLVLGLLVVEMWMGLLVCLEVVENPVYAVHQQETEQWKDPSGPVELTTSSRTHELPS